MKKGFIVAALCVGTVIAIWTLMWFTYNRQDVQYRNLAVAQENVIKTNFDKMWKVIKTIAQVPEQAVSSFQKMYQPLIEGRYEGEKGDVMMKWITEQNPAFDWSLYGKLQTAIEANRTDFFYEQAKLISIKKQHDDLRLMPPSKWFVGNRPEIKITIISSAATDEVMKSGQENNIDLYKSN